MSNSISARHDAALEKIAAAIAEAGRAYQSSVTEALAALGSAFDGRVEGPASAERPHGVLTPSKLGDRLRAFDPHDDREWKDLEAFAAAADRLERERDAADAAVERLEDLAENLAGHGDAITRCNLVAQRVRAAIDGPKEDA